MTVVHVSAFALLVAMAYGLTQLGFWLRRQTRFPFFRRYWWLYLAMGIYGWIIVFVAGLSLVLDELKQ